jgi:tripartite-type tricarboxylate transporter receptor subunit TctC
MLAACAIALGAAAPVHAQQYPSKPVRFISAFAPGGGSEVALRVVAQKLQESGWPSTIIENKPGAGGVVAAEAAKQSAPDGYTVLQADAAAFGINVTLIPNLPYDPVKDFTPIMLTWSFPSVLAVPANSPAKTGAEFIALAKSKRGGLTYASSGIGSGGHLLGTMLQNSVGAAMTHAPYKGAGQAMPDVAAGRVDFIYASIGSVRQYVDAGTVRLLATTALKRMDALPDVPTMTELGHPAVFLDIWFGLVGPPKMPPEIARKIHDDAAKVLRSPEVTKRLADMGLFVDIKNPDEFRELIQSDIARFGKIVKEANIKLE